MAEYGLPTTVTYQSPVNVVTNAHGRVFVDFGRDAFGWLELLPPPGFTGGTYQAILSEARHADDTCDGWPGGSIRRSWQAPVFLPAGNEPIRIAMSPDEDNTDSSRMPPPVLIPGKYGVVLPFRYVEFFETPFEISPRTIRRAMVHYPLDMEESSFSCSDKGLERVYDFCKYSILATSYAGLYVDGDRERIPYEGDAYINQMGQYAISSDMALPRASHEYLIRHSTWPTEWKQHSIMMAWADWMWSGETTSVARCYEHLKTQKLLPDRIRADGLVMSPPQAITGPCSQIDLIDWPPRDRDGYVFCPASAVINAFHYRNLREMADLAKALFKDADAMEFACRAERLRERYNVLFWDDRAELYRDGEGADHHGLHANVVALAFGLTPDSRRGKVADYIVSRGMACSVYFSQYVLEALYVGGRPETALAIMTARGNRSWLGMLEQGATITMEAWNLNDKPNLDWNHAWGTPPLNVIARYVLGVTPLKPGFAKARIAPQPAGLTNVNGVVPTVKGGIAVNEKTFVMESFSFNPNAWRTPFALLFT